MAARSASSGTAASTACTSSPNRDPPGRSGPRASTMETSAGPPDADPASASTAPRPPREGPSSSNNPRCSDRGSAVVSLVRSSPGLSSIAAHSVAVSTETEGRDPSAIAASGTSLTISDSRRMPIPGSTPRSSAFGSHQTQVYGAPSRSLTWAPGQTVVDVAGSPSGRRHTESVLNAGQPDAGSARRRAAVGGYSASFNGLVQPPSYSMSPTAGTTRRSRARVAAT